VISWRPNHWLPLGVARWWVRRAVSCRMYGEIWLPLELVALPLRLVARLVFRFSGVREGICVKNVGYRSPTSSSWANASSVRCALELDRPRTSGGISTDGSSTSNFALISLNFWDFILANLAGFRGGIDGGWGRWGGGVSLRKFRASRIGVGGRLRRWKGTGEGCQFKWCQQLDLFLNLFWIVGRRLMIRLYCYMRHVTLYPYYLTTSMFGTELLYELSSWESRNTYRTQQCLISIF